MSNTIKLNELPVLDVLNDTDKLVVGQHNGQFAVLPASKLPKPEGGGGGDDPYIINGNAIFDAQDPSDVRAEMWKFITAIKANKNRRVFVARASDSNMYATMRSVDFNFSDESFELYISQIFAVGEPLGPDAMCDVQVMAVRISGNYSDTEVTYIEMERGMTTVPNLQYAPDVSIGEVASIVGVNLQGDVVKVESSQLMGIDYSKLEEQIVPGLFLLDINGYKKQAYTRSFKGTVPKKDSYGNYAIHVLWHGLVTSATILHYNRKSASGWTEDYAFRNITFGEATGPFANTVLLTWSSFDGNFTEGDPFILTMMYTK